jgi:hypothetical protein
MKEEKHSPERANLIKSLFSSEKFWQNILFINSNFSTKEGKFYLFVVHSPPHSSCYHFHASSIMQLMQMEL